MIPSVDQSELDGSLGVAPPSSGKLLAVLGTSSAGTLNAPASFANSNDVLSTFGYGPLTEVACRSIDTEHLPVVCVRVDDSGAAGAMGTIDDSGVTGTAVTFITHTASTEPFDDYQVVVKIIAGGTLGVAGITYQYSLDGGTNFSQTQALGTSLILAIPNSGVSFTITTAKTLIAADTFTAPTTAPQPSGSDIAAGLAALKDTLIIWEESLIANPLDATKFDTVETSFAGLPGAGLYRWWCANTRVPTAAETEGAYLSSLSTAFGAKSTKVGCLCAGQAYTISSVPGRVLRYTRPASFSVGPRIAAISPQLDAADVSLGSLPGVSLRNGNGNPVLGIHDEFRNPGLDDARFTTLRTWPRKGGTYITNPRIFSPAGSDFDLVQLRRVMNLAREASYDALQERLNKSILVNKKTGFILEKEAVEIEAFVTGRIGAAIGAQPMASGWTFVLSRTDNILSTKTLNGEARVIPLGYVKKIIERIGFTNPALSVVGV